MPILIVTPFKNIYIKNLKYLPIICILSYKWQNVIGGLENKIGFEDKSFPSSTILPRGNIHKY